MKTILICIKNWSLSTCWEIDVGESRCVHTWGYVCMCITHIQHRKGGREYKTENTGQKQKWQAFLESVEKSLDKMPGDLISSPATVNQ